MHVRNVHERSLRASPQAAGALLDTLASHDDRLWPRHAWPRMAFDRPLQVGARGGHGPIRYVVEAYAAQRSIRFRFTGPAGFEGWHGYEVLAAADGGCRLRHVLEMRTQGPARISWPLLFRPLHDALIEDSLTRAQLSLGEEPTRVAWSAPVKLLRWLLSSAGSRPPDGRG